MNGKNASSGSFADAARFGEVIVFATLWGGTENAIKLAGVDSFKGKVVIDATNPLVFTEGRPPQLALGWNDSGGEQVQRWLPDAKVVKAFNIVGNAHFVHPDFPDGPPDMFIAGNDAGAKKMVSGFLEQFGWVAYALQTGTSNHAFKLLRK
jgi:8-hydroxy-5-deazaflavin:NADPH oxidoreductase